MLPRGVEDADSRSPSEHGAVVGGHGMFESLLPVKVLVVRVDHGKISVEGVESVACECACLCVDEGAA